MTVFYEYSLLAVECLYGGTNLRKLEVQSKFTFPVRGVFRTQPNIYDGTFCRNSSRLNADNYFCKNAFS